MGSKAACPDVPTPPAASSSSSCYTRRAAHAGSWYTDRTKTLATQLQGWLDEASAEVTEASGQVKAIISPHAGYSYSGPTAAYAYSYLDTRKFQRIFILGPSHHVYLKSCAISGASTCETPVGDLKVDDEVRTALLETGLFQRMTREVDEDEHSIEMQLPYVAKLVNGSDVKVVPIMVGSIDPKQEAEYGRILAPYLQNPANFFIISSDFCHWGSRFRYQPYDKSYGEVADYIEWLDREGMKIIEDKDADGFTSYMGKHHNTICGRHPISVLLQAIKAMSSAHQLSSDPVSIRFVRYTQSSRCKTKNDSSVSYASAIAQLVVDS